MTAFRLPLVGRVHSLRLTASGVTFKLVVNHANRHVSEFTCRSSRPDVIDAALTLEVDQLVGIIGTAPKAPLTPTCFNVERLEVLGCKTRREAMA